MTPQDIFTALFSPQAPDSPQNLEMQAMAAPGAGMGAPSPQGPMVSAPMPPSRPMDILPRGNPMQPAQGPQKAAPSGNVLARLDNPNAGLSSMAGLTRTSDPWLAFAQGYGGAQKAQAERAESQRKNAAELYKTMLADARAAWKDKRDDRRLDSEIEAKKEANAIAMKRIDAYKEVAGGKEQNGVDADYKKAITRKNLLGELNAYRTQLGLDTDDAESIPSRKLNPDERARREALYKAKEAEISKMLPAIGGGNSKTVATQQTGTGDEEDDPASVGAEPPMPPTRPVEMPKAVMQLPEGMTHDSARAEAQAAISARPDLRDQIIERLTGFGTPVDGL